MSGFWKSLGNLAIVGLAYGFLTSLLGIGIVLINIGVRRADVCFFAGFGFLFIFVVLSHLMKHP